MLVCLHRCVWIAAPAQRRVDFDFKSGLHANDASRVAKKEHLKPLEAELVKLEGMADEILKSFEYLQEREAEHRNTNGETALVSEIQFVRHQHLHE